MKSQAMVQIAGGVVAFGLSISVGLTVMAKTDYWPVQEWGGGKWDSEYWLQ